MSTSTWSTIGGDVVLDLVNTVTWRTDPARRADWLTRPAALVEWASAMDLPVTLPVVGTEVRPALARIREIRDLLGAILDEHVLGRPPEARLLEGVRRRYEAACASADQVCGLPLRWHVEPVGAERLATFLEVAAGEFLRRPDLALVRSCQGPGCGWLFLDGTRNHSRRWCDSAECGNRARVRRHALKVNGSETPSVR